MADHHTRHNPLGQDALFSTPTSLMLDARLTPLERNGWQVLRMLRSAEGFSPLANLGQLRRYLTSTPLGQRAGYETARRVLVVLRLTGWISLVGQHRDPLTGHVLSELYQVHESALHFPQACALDTSLSALLQASIGHENNQVDRVAVHIRATLAERRYVTNISKARELGTGLEQVTDAHVRMSLQLQAAFGLRREEAIKFQPSYADRGDHIALKGSWTKGGRERTVPVITAEQRDVLQAAHHLAGTGSLIPADKTFIQQRHVYDGQCKAAGLSNMHGLRHQYAQSRYEALTGWKAPAAGGPQRQSLTMPQLLLDTEARESISKELGHNRAGIVSAYCGR